MIRNMTIADYDALYKLWQQTKGVGLNDVDDTKEGIERLLLRNPEFCFVYEISGEIVGGLLAGHDGRRGFIYHTCVSEAYRNQKIGSQLVASCLRAFKKAQISKIGLFVLNTNQAGNDFWQHQGFTTRNDVTYRNQALVQMTRFDS